MSESRGYEPERPGRPAGPLAVGGEGPDEYLTTTISTCGECPRRLPARVHVAGGGVWMRKDCPDHGPQEIRVHSDAKAYLDHGRFFRAASMPLGFRTAMTNGCPDSCGLCPEHEQHVCMPIIEITDHCDLACPVCLVGNRSSFHLSRAQVAGILDGLIAAEGQVDVVSLSGGEPTLNPDFRGIVDECLGRSEILRVSVSTNGLTLLRDPDLLRYLAERNVVISLQFDGLDDGIYRRLRGRPLLGEKMRLIDRVGRLDAPMSLTVTIASGINDAHLGEIVELFFERSFILSTMFQPAAYTGRGERMGRPSDATTIPDVMRAIDGACRGIVSAGDFSPLPCSHPACFSLAFYLRVEDGGFLPVKRFLEVDRYLDILQNRAIFGTDPESFELVKTAVYDLWSGPAAQAPDSQKALTAVKRLLEPITRRGGYEPRKALGIAERSIKSIFIHAFMDRHTFDLARARKCCNVYPLADGRLVPVCVYNCLGGRPCPV